MKRLQSLPLEPLLASTLLTLSKSSKANKAPRRVISRNYSDGLSLAQGADHNKFTEAPGTRSSPSKRQHLRQSYKFSVKPPEQKCQFCLYKTPNENDVDAESWKSPNVRQTEVKLYHKAQNFRSEDVKPSPIPSLGYSFSDKAGR